MGNRLSCDRANTLVRGGARAMSEKGDKASADSEAKSVDIHYIKSDLFRSIHADGAYGGVTSRGYLHVAFYNERRTIPKTMTVSMDADTHESHEVIKDTRGGIVREVDVGVILDERAVGELIEWLTRKIPDIQNVKKLITKEDDKDDG